MFLQLFAGVNIEKEVPWFWTVILSSVDTIKNDMGVSVWIEVNQAIVFQSSEMVTIAEPRLGINQIDFVSVLLSQLADAIDFIVS